MSYKIEFLADKEIVVLRSSGTYELEAEIETVRRVIDTLKERGCSRCLFDHRQTEVVARTIGSYDRPTAYAKFGLKRSVKMAIVLQDLTEDLRFYELVCRNRGWDVRIFDDYDVAIDWLTG